DGEGADRAAVRRSEDVRPVLAVGVGPLDVLVAGDVVDARRLPVESDVARAGGHLEELRLAATVEVEPGKVGVRIEAAFEVVVGARSLIDRHAAGRGAKVDAWHTAQI